MEKNLIMQIKQGTCTKTGVWGVQLDLPTPTEQWVDGWLEKITNYSFCTNNSAPMCTNTVNAHHIIIIG